MTLEEILVKSFLSMLGSSLIYFFWYGLLACIGVWLVFYLFYRAAYSQRRISDLEQTPGQTRREFLYSLRSIAIFGLVTGLVVYASCFGWTRLYTRPDEYGWPWFVLSIGVMVFIHDAYFYWTHRLMHIPWLYRMLHHTHHRSLSPTPWAAYAFSTGEAFVQAGQGVVIVLLIPVHREAYGIFMFIQIVFNAFGHCGYEIFPRRFLRSRLGLFLNSVTHHAMHHEKFRANYGLYFNVWDRLMGTNHPDYEQRFELATGSPPDQARQLDDTLQTGEKNSSEYSSQTECSSESATLVVDSPTRPPLPREPVVEQERSRILQG